LALFDYFIPRFLDIIFTEFRHADPYGFLNYFNRHGFSDRHQANL
jgi:hypothetical protein